VAVCGVEIKGKEAILVLVDVKSETSVQIKCETKKLQMVDHQDTKVIEDMLATIKAFAHEYKVEVFVIKSRALSGMMAGGGITFKIETVFQLSGTATAFVSPQTLAKFAKSNLGGIPSGLFAYQQDAYRAGAYYLANN
jgi:Protein of unknown function (DUF3010)